MHERMSNKVEIAIVITFFGFYLAGSSLLISLYMHVTYGLWGSCKKHFRRFYDYQKFSINYV